ncbi:MAG: putative metalloprotease CJM1_0395 family protein [Syntrophobacteraceae bacterium]|nr:SprA-related family protein [Desulfobacteraceae bacterium]
MAISGISGLDSSYGIPFAAAAGTARGATTGSECGANELSVGGTQAGRNACAKNEGVGADGIGGTGSGSRAKNGEPLTAEEQDRVRELKRRDAEVRAHEQSHLAAGSQYTRSGASYEFTAGPDGVQYAVGGEVSIDTSPIADDPSATVRKMAVVKRAALAPARPSGQDYSIAAKAEASAAEARQEMQKQAAGKVGTGSGFQAGTKGTNLDRTA